MKYRQTRRLSGVICFFVLFVYAQGAWGAIGGSAHDFSGQSWSGGKICAPCHTPHNADNSMTGAPLWDHEVTTATYTLYSSPTMDATVEQPGPVSKACLSCHDGTVAVDSFGGQTGSAMIGGTAELGTDLSNDHPIGIRWDHSVTSGSGFNSPGCSTCHGPPDILDVTVVQFYNRYLECATCHDVHNAFNLPGLTRVTMVGSQLCLTCHTDK